MRRHGIRFGFGDREITPTVKVSLAGYFGERLWDHVLDDIHVYALYLEGGDRKAIVVVFDLCHLSPGLVQAVQRAARVLGIDGRHLMVCATHTHTAPAVRPEAGGVEEYNTYAAGQAQAAMADAVRNAADGRLAVGGFEEPRFAFCRRYWMKDGTVVSNPGKRNPEIDKPESGIDAAVQVAGFYRAGRLDTLLLVLSNHVDTIGGNGVSADWPGVLRGFVQKEAGIPHVIVATSPSGNINLFDVTSGASQTRRREAARIGRGYGRAVLRFLQKDLTLNDRGRLAEVSSDELAVASAILRIQPRLVPPETLAAARRDAALEVPAGGPLTSEDLARGSPAARKVFATALLEYERTKKATTVRVGGMRIGEFQFLSLPGEPFHEVAVALRAHAAGALFVTQLSGADYVGYIPLKACFARGGYETLALSSPCVTDTADRLVAAAKRVLNRLADRRHK